MNQRNITVTKIYSNHRLAVINYKICNAAFANQFVTVDAYICIDYLPHLPDSAGRLDILVQRGFGKLGVCDNFNGDLDRQSKSF